MHSTTSGRPDSIMACSWGATPRSVPRIEACARSTTRSVAVKTPARAMPSLLKVTNFMSGISCSCDAIAVDHGAIDLDPETGAGGDCDHALDLMDRLFREMVAEGVFFLLEFQHRRHRKQ